MKLLQAGLSYVEVLVAVLLISVALVPMMNALLPGIQGSTEHKQIIEHHYSLAGVMESVLAEDFFALDAAATEAGSHTTETSYSDASAELPYKVYIWRYDADNADSDSYFFTGGEDDLLWIKVETDNGLYSLETLLSKY